MEFHPALKQTGFFISKSPDFLLSFDQGSHTLSIEVCGKVFDPKIFIELIDDLKKITDVMKLVKMKANEGKIEISAERAYMLQVMKSDPILTFLKKEEKTRTGREGNVQSSWSAFIKGAEKLMSNAALEQSKKPGALKF